MSVTGRRLYQHSPSRQQWSRFEWKPSIGNHLERNEQFNPTCPKKHSLRHLLQISQNSKLVEALELASILKLFEMSHPFLPLVLILCCKPARCKLHTIDRGQVELKAVVFDSLSIRDRRDLCARYVRSCVVDQIPLLLRTVVHQAAVLGYPHVPLAPVPGFEDVTVSL